MTKKISIFIMLALLIGFSSCEKDDEATVNQLEVNRELAKRVSTEVVLQNNLNVDEIIADDFVYHQAASGTTMQRQDCLDFWQSITAAFPDIEITFRDIVAKDDLVAIRYTSHATHTGDAFFGIPAANTVINGSGLIIRRIENDKIAEEWDFADTGSLMEQLTTGQTKTITDYSALTTSETSIDENITLAKRVSEEVVLQHNLNVDELISSDFTYHMGGTGTIMEREATLGFWQNIMTAFPDLSLSFEQMFGEGNIAVIRYTNTGTGADGATFFGNSVEGKTINSGGIIMRRIENGKIAEEWDFTDVSKILEDIH